MTKTRTNTKKKASPKPADSSLQISSTSEVAADLESTKGIVDFKFIDPKSLTPNELNWRVHGLNQKKALRASRQKFGDIKPVIWNRRTGKLIDGHARVEDAIAQGQDSIPVAVVDLDENDEAEALLVLDSIGSMATTDERRVNTLGYIIDRNRKAIGARIEPPEVGKTLRNLYASIRKNADRFATNDFSVRGQVDEAPALPSRSETDDEEGDYEPFEQQSYAGDSEEDASEDSESFDVDAEIDRRLESFEGTEEEKEALRERLKEGVRNLDHASVPPETVQLAISLVNAKWPFAEPTDLEIPALSDEVDNPAHYVQAESLPGKLVTWGGSGNPHPGPHAIYCISSSPYPIDRRGGYLFTHTNDSRFDHLWKDPSFYALNIIEDGWKGVLEPEYSLYGDNDFPVNLSNLYRRRRLSRYYQELGIPIIPVISAFQNPYSFYLPIDSLPQGVPVVSFQVRGLPKEPVAREKQFELMLDVLQYAVEDVEPKAVILYGAAEPKYWQYLEPRLPAGPRYLPTMAYTSLRREGVKEKKRRLAKAS